MKILNQRPIYKIAEEINENWKNIYFGAKPYLSAMFTLTNIHDNFGCDSAKSIIIYFLGNAQNWRGETARKIKKELNNIIKEN